jgi:hypothetical protein
MGLNSGHMTTQEQEHICYKYTFDDGVVLEYPLDIDSKTWMLKLEQQELPEWTRLEFNRCAHCPLKSSEVSHCPAAVNLSTIGEEWDSKRSFDEVTVEIDMDNKKTIGRASAQVGLSSLVGLLLATSDCPYLRFFRPMARFHQPLGKPEDAGIRVLMSYLAYVSLLGKSVEDTTVEIERIYDYVDSVNKHLVGRITRSNRENASVQAIVQLDCMSKLIRLSIEDSFRQLGHLFEPYKQMQGIME